MFEVGDLVEATRKITRFDHMSLLNVGERARITSVFNGERCQVVNIEIQGRLPVIDIVCFEDESPLKKISLNTTGVDHEAD